MKSEDTEALEWLRSKNINLCYPNSTEIRVSLFYEPNKPMIPSNDLMTPNSDPTCA